MNLKWHKASEILPTEDRRQYLTIVNLGINCYYYKLLNFTTDLYSVDEYDFSDKKNKCGWYFYDSEWGYCEYKDVVYWLELPKLPDEIDMVFN